MRNIIHEATRDSAVSSLPEDSTDGFRDSIGHCERFEIVSLHPVGTAQTWIRTLTSHYVTSFLSAYCVHATTLSHTIGRCYYSLESG